MLENNQTQKKPSIQPVVNTDPVAPVVQTSSMSENQDVKIVNPVDNIKQDISSDGPFKKIVLPIFIGVLMIGMGLGSGYGLAVANSSNNMIGGVGKITEPNLKREVDKSDISKGTKVGIADESTFKDSADGLLKKGGLDGEGSHRLERPGGEDQTLYITSSVIDLDQFIDRKVKVWGETFNGQKVGWLMDVGKLEVIE